jgi:integrase
MVILSEAEQQRLLNACGPGLRELVAMGAWTGARWGELANARIRDFDPEQETLELDGKTGHRTIHLPPQAVSLLQRLTAARSSEEFLLTPAGGTHWTENLHRRPFCAAAAEVGLPDGTVYYSLRHSYISGALKHLVPVKALADHCGTSITMIARHYAKFIDVDKSRYAEVAAPRLDLNAGDTKAFGITQCSGLTGAA